MLMPVFYSIGQILLLFSYLDGNLCQSETDYIIDYLNTHSAGPFEESQFEDLSHLSHEEIEESFYNIVDILSYYPEISVDSAKLSILEVITIDGNISEIEKEYYYLLKSYLEEYYHPEY